MQYSTLRVSMLVAVFSASTALALLDCGGGRAPPKTTVPGCPGYVDPTAVSSITIATSVIASPTGSGAHPNTIGSLSSGSYNSNGYICGCSGSLCVSVQPGCVSIGQDGVASTVTASPGYQTKSFDVNEHPTTSFLTTRTTVITKSPANEITTTKPTSANTTTKPTSANTTTQPTSANTTAVSTMSTVVSTIVNTTSTANTTAPKISEPAMTGSPNGASKASGLSTLAIVAVFGMGAMAWL